MVLYRDREGKERRGMEGGGGDTVAETVYHSRLLLIINA